ncbi:uncharacterized protein LOC121052649 [Rosa chinensis]|uniref:uncharacterized protein LOC121052649 n=1 Tax=Rosa chinensis TaxID=74649 RepID=UPI001AD913C9|nr:uncharacterized protein LOC121052649 [Rosa chinensis]
MQQHDFSHQNFSPHVSYTNSENYSQQSYSDNNGKNSFSRPHISNNKSYNTGQSYSGSVVCQICEKPGEMQVLYGGPQVQGYSQIPVTREDDNGSKTNIENTQNVSQDEYVSTSKEKQEVVSKEVSKEKIESESENGDEGNQPEKFMEESSDEKDTFPFELCLPDEDSLITVVDYKDMVERNQVKADGVSLSAAVDSSSKPMDSKIGIQDANSSQVYKSEAINDVSDMSSSSSMSNDMYKPHKVNGVRWEAIQAVRDHDGMLGLNHFKLLNSKHNTQGVGLSHLKNKKVDSSATTSICSCSRAGSEEKENSDLNKDAAENKAFIPPYSIPSKWQQAILKEIDTLLIQGTWQLPCTSLERPLLNCRQACRPMKLWQLPLISPG